MMDRRVALKNMGLALGYTVAVPTLVGIAQSCKNTTAPEWIPEFYTQDEGHVLRLLADIILPKTETPSATEVDAHVFADKFAAEVFDKKQQDFAKTTLGRFMDKALEAAGRQTPAKLTGQDLEPVLAQALKASKTEQKANKKAIGDYHKAMADGTPAQLGDALARYAFADSDRGLVILGYKCNEYVGENVLDYLPVPGVYQPCGDLQELTGGKAWSL